MCLNALHHKGFIVCEILVEHWSNDLTKQKEKEMNINKKNKVRTQLKKSVGFCWDECHKIYILLDDNQVELSKQYKYDIVLTDKNNIENSLNTIAEWYDNSCSLKFVNAVKTNEDNTDEYIDVIRQGA